MKIPARFSLLGTHYNVRTVPKIDEETVAYFDPQKCLIALRSGLSKEQREHAFLHELVHAALHAMNNELYSDEQFVDVLSGLLHQALK